MGKQTDRRLEPKQKKRWNRTEGKYRQDSKRETYRLNFSEHTYSYPHLNPELISFSFSFPFLIYTQLVRLFVARETFLV